MKKPKTNDSKRIFQIKVTLRDTRPPIWRRLLVRDTVPLGQFHDLLQVVMGWTDSHAHQFMKGAEYYGPKELEMPEVRDESRVRLKEVLQKPKDRLLYEYDFGDGWLHDVVLERVDESEPKGKYPWVLAGKRACPPEDCGGIPGYYELLQVLKNPRHPNRKETLEWLGEPFDPGDFDAYERNTRFHGGWYRARPPGA